MFQRNLRQQGNQSLPLRAIRCQKNLVDITVCYKISDFLFVGDALAADYFLLTLLIQRQYRIIVENAHNNHKLIPPSHGKIKNPFARHCSPCKWVSLENNYDPFDYNNHIQLFVKSQLLFVPFYESSTRTVITDIAMSYDPGTVTDKNVDTIIKKSSYWKSARRAQKSVR